MQQSALRYGKQTKLDVSHRLLDLVLNDRFWPGFADERTRCDLAVRQKHEAYQLSAHVAPT
jgi:hypothetical protein